jgi:hypothetical protein
VVRNQNENETRQERGAEGKRSEPDTRVVKDEVGRKTIAVTMRSNRMTAEEKKNLISLALFESHGRHVRSNR